MTASRIIVALACLALLGATSPAERLAEAERDAATSAARIRQLDQAAQTAVDQATRLSTRAAALAARVQQSEAVLAAAEARVGMIDAAIARQRRILGERQGRIVNLLAALESMSRRPPALALVQPGSVRETARVALLLDGVLPVIRTRTADLRHSLAVFQALKKRATDAQQHLVAARERLDASRLLLLQQEKARRMAAADIATQSMLESDRALALSVESKDLRELIGELGSQAKLRERLASLPGPVPRPARIAEGALPPPIDRVQRSAAPAAHRKASLVLPALGKVITGFGELSDAGVRSRGLTVETRSRAQVVAPAAGRIAFAGPFREFGNIIIIEHQDGLTTLLSGMDVLDARVGDKVVAGGPVGRMGDNRRQLTLEVRESGQPVNPLPLVEGN